jgi:hypothetical protein
MKEPVSLAQGNVPLHISGSLIIHIAFVGADPRVCPLFGGLNHGKYRENIGKRAEIEEKRPDFIIF